MESLCAAALRPLQSCPTVSSSPFIDGEWLDRSRGGLSQVALGMCPRVRRTQRLPLPLTCEQHRIRGIVRPRGRAPGTRCPASPVPGPTQHPHL